MSEPIKSRHASILNALDEMQKSPAYAVRRQVLADAERVIVQQEQRIRELEGEVRDAARGAADEARWRERQGEDYGSY